MKSKSTIRDGQIDLDEILVEIGETGRYRTVTWTLWCLVVLLSSLPYMSYIFTAGQLDYRCAVPQCERVRADAVADDFAAATWLRYAVPFGPSGKPASCERYRYVGGETAGGQLECDEAAFNRSQIEQCEQGFVYDSDEVTIVKEFNITCTDSGWKLAMIGTLTYMASCLLLPVCAIISDRYGRRPILIANLLLSGCCGIITSLSVSYTMFATMQFVTAMVSSGTFMTVFVLSIESSGPGQRVFIGTLLSAVYSFGQGMAGMLASQVLNFRTYMQLLFAPSFVVMLLIWWVPESMRWLLAKERVREARTILVKAAKVNGVQLSEKTQQLLLEHSTLPDIQDLAVNDKMLPVPAMDTPPYRNPFVTVMRSRMLILRLLNCLFSWFTNSLIYYGMNIHAVALAGSKYTNFILVNLVEVPAIFAAYYLMERYGRNRILSAFLAINGVACLLSEFVVSDASTASRLLLYIVGKCGVTVSFTVLYVYTTELFPTAMRQTFMNTCSTVGAIGSMIAPLTPLLAGAWSALPMLMFGGTALASSGLVLWLPETLNSRLPDTVEDAERIGVGATAEAAAGGNVR